MSWLAGIAFVGIVALSAVAQSEYHKTLVSANGRSLLRYPLVLQGLGMVLQGLGREFRIAVSRLTLNRDYTNNPVVSANAWL